MYFVANHHTDLKYSEQTTGILSSSIVSLSIFVGYIHIFLCCLFQPLNICFTSSLPSTVLELVEDGVKPSEIGVSCYIHAQEWDLEPYIESETTIAATEEGYSPILNIRGLASRKYSFFLWNIIIIMVIVVVAFMSQQTSLLNVR